MCVVHPCPCGTFSHPQKACTCAPALVTKYQKRLSGPLLDRLDVPVEVPRVDYDKLSSERVEESSAPIRARVQTARFQLISDREEAAEVEENAEDQRFQAWVLEK